MKEQTAMLLGALLLVIFLLLNMIWSKGAQSTTSEPDLYVATESAVFMRPAGGPSSIPCSSEIDPNCMEYHP